MKPGKRDRIGQICQRLNKHPKGLVTKYRGWDGAFENVVVKKNTQPTPSIWHKTECPPLNEGGKLHDPPPIKHNPTKSHVVDEIVVLFSTFS